ncbi:MAG: hypothetical protein GQE15_42930 [Archangiaceae bacterium]|nr:hypothetical protein [Archangiaceae bacterium]
MRWFALGLLLNGCSGDPRHVAGAVVWVVGDALDRVVHGAKYRAAFEAAHPECLPSTVSDADGNGSGTCTTTQGCRREVSCFLDCDARETCP